MKTLIFAFLLLSVSAFSQKIAGHRYVSLGAEFAFSDNYVGNAIGVSGCEFLNVSEKFQGGLEAGVFYTNFRQDGVNSDDVRFRVRGVFRYLIDRQNIVYIAPAVLNLDALEFDYESAPYFGYQWTKQYLKWGLEGHIYRNQVLPTIRFQVVLRAL